MADKAPGIPLEPCPMCGSAKQITSGSDGPVYCRECGLRALSPEHWNRRHSAPATKTGTSPAQAWDHLKARCCSDPKLAKRCVMVGKDDFLAAIAGLRSSIPETLRDKLRPFRDVKAMSADPENNRVLKLHFKRASTAADREAILAAVNASGPLAITEDPSAPSSP